MTKIELVFSDIDGTLLNSKHEVTAEASQIIQDLVKKGTKIILASARPPGAMVSIEDTIKGFRMILDGEVDNLPEQAFLNVGTIEEAMEKGKKLLEQAKK